MVNTINMQDMRHLNLFSKITNVSTPFCFNYNEMIFFVVPYTLLPKALGPDARNLRKISDILRKRIRIIAQPREIKDAEKFIRAVIAPVEFNDIEVNEDEIIITGGSHNKAALLGRGKRRLLEMEKILAYYFKRGYRII